MRRFYLWRSNLRKLEPYHQYKTLSEFEQNCYDFWLQFPLQLLKLDLFDEVIIWRLQPKRKQEDIIFEFNQKKYIQKWVDNFSECFSYSSPDISFFRGGFSEYDAIIKKKKKHFGLSLYTGTGRRIHPQYGGIYDFYLMEDDNDINHQTHLPFFKTAIKNIFKPIDSQKIYDLFWPANFEQLNYKGQEFFIEQVSKSNFLKSLKIVHVGNRQERGISLCKKYNISNIEFKGLVPKNNYTELANQSKFGLIASNRNDGCPRVLTELMCIELPIFLRKTTRKLKWYEDGGIVLFNDKNIEEMLQNGYQNYSQIKQKCIEKAPFLNLDFITKLNYDIWIQNKLSKERI